MMPKINTINGGAEFVLDVKRVFKKRNIGEIRCSVITDYSGKMSKVLSRFGLKPDQSRLTEQSREDALKILTRLLWKDQAYDYKCMRKSEAKTLAEEILATYEDASSRYFSNKDLSRFNGDTWVPMTRSTFDSGVIVSSDDYRYFCIWFEDED